MFEKNTVHSKSSIQPMGHHWHNKSTWWMWNWNIIIKKNKTKKSLLYDFYFERFLISSPCIVGPVRVPDSLSLTRPFQAQPFVLRGLLLGLTKTKAQKHIIMTRPIWKIPSLFVTKFRVSKYDILALYAAWPGDTI